MVKNVESGWEDTHTDDGNNYNGKMCWVEQGEFSDVDEKVVNTKKNCENRFLEEYIKWVAISHQVEKYVLLLIRALPIRY